MSLAREGMELVVTSVTGEAQGIACWEFRRAGGGELPPHTAGAHIELRLANGLERSYSLCNSQDERGRYVVAISKDPNSRGGSRFIHESLKVGDTIRALGPHNHFPLVEDATHVVFIAGGIGITPIWCMIQRLESLGRSWELHYSTRVREMCAFERPLEALERAKPGRVHLNFDQEPGGEMTDLRALLAAAPREAHLYCCGPKPMLEAFESAAKASGYSQAQVHVEYFTAREKAAVDGGYTIVLRRSGKSFVVSPGKTILETLLENDIDVPYSCREGVCGSCETPVLDGVPDHRDSVLSREERAANRTMMICCSASKTPRLVLDI